MHIAGVVDTKLIDVHAEAAVGMRKRELLSSHSSTCAWVLSSFGNSSILQGTASRARHCCCLAAVAGCSQCIVSQSEVLGRFYNPNTTPKDKERGVVCLRGTGQELH